MKLKVAIGTSDFRSLRESGAYYLDKSDLISQLVTSDAKVLLLPRPRRFGKTLNLSMLQCFFDMRQNASALFEGLQVTRDSAAMSQLNAFPTIFVTFRSIEETSWKDAERKLQLLIGTLVGQHIELALTTADPIQKQILHELHAGKAEPQRYGSALFLLTELLFKATGKKVVFLMDEYDKPIHCGRSSGYLAEVVPFMRGLLGETLKDNPYLERAVITGILRVAKESIYSGLNNLAVYSILDPEFSSCFGFTESEVHQLLLDAGLADKEEGVKTWYNGYKFGQGQVIYNPWSILNYVSRSAEGLKAHWLGTSANDLAREMIQEGTGLDLSELELLIEGRTVTKHLNVNVDLRDITAESIWNILLFTGYLTAENYDPAEETAELSIPNTEVRYFFKKKVSSWFGKGSPDKLIALLLKEQMAAFAKGLSEAVKSILSFHDTAGTTSERVYHIFVVGMMLHLRDTYRIESNFEAGHGRADLVLIPRNPKTTGFIFEFKASKEPQDLVASAEAALKQIEERDYPSRLRQEQVMRLVAIGLAFRGKHIALATYHQDLTSGERSVAEHFCEGSPAKPSKTKAPSNKSKSSSKTSDEQQQKLLIIGKIQLLQEMKDQVVLPTESMISADLKLLQAMLTQLKGS